MEVASASRDMEILREVVHVQGFNHVHGLNSRFLEKQWYCAKYNQLMADSMIWIRNASSDLVLLD